MSNVVGCCAGPCTGCGSEDEKMNQLETIIKKHGAKPGSLIQILHEAQELFGYLPEAVQRRVAEALDIPESEVYGVVTFYSFFSTKPRGRYRIGVCLGTACYVKGSAEVLEAIKKELGVNVEETTDDCRFTLEVTRCVGACGLAPVMTVGDDVYGRVSPDRVPEILAKYE